MSLSLSGVMEKLAEYYTHFNTIMYEEFSLPAVHSQVRYYNYMTTLLVT